MVFPWIYPLKMYHPGSEKLIHLRPAGFFQKGVLGRLRSQISTKKRQLEEVPWMWWDDDKGLLRYHMICIVWNYCGMALWNGIGMGYDGVE